MKLAALVVALAVPTGAVADTKGEEDAIVINPLNVHDFEVIEGANFGAAEYWCGAATYVERRTNRSALTPIYLKQARGPSVSVPGRKGVVFTTRPPGGAKTGAPLTLSVDDPGRMLKSVKARRYCRDAFTRSTK